VPKEWGIPKISGAQGKVEGHVFHEHLALKAVPDVNQWQKIKTFIFFPRYHGKKI
jgi:hypothetical protein